MLKLQPTQARTLRALSLLATSATCRGRRSASFCVRPFWLRDDCLAAMNWGDVVARHISVVVLEEHNNAVTDRHRVEALARVWAQWRQLKRDRLPCPTLHQERKSNSWGSPPVIDEAVRECRRVLGL